MPQPVKPLTMMSGPSPRPPMKYPAFPSMVMLMLLVSPTARLCRPRGSVMTTLAPSGSARRAWLISRVVRLRRVQRGDRGYRVHVCSPVGSKTFASLMPGSPVSARYSLAMAM